MGLITIILVWIFSTLANLITNVLSNDICASADRVCKKIIQNAASRLASFDRQSFESEWLSDLSERETTSEKYKHAIGCFLVAGKMRRQAEMITIEMKLLVVGIGRVPLTVSLGPSLLSSVLYSTCKLPRVMQYPVSLIFVCYMFAKLLRSAHRTAPEKLQHFANQLRHDKLKEWSYEAHIVSKGFNLDVSKWLRMMVLHPDMIPQILDSFLTALQSVFDKRVSES